MKITTTTLHWRYIWADEPWLPLQCPCLVPTLPDIPNFGGHISYVIMTHPKEGRTYNKEVGVIGAERRYLRLWFAISFGFSSTLGFCTGSSSAEEAIEITAALDSIHSCPWMTAFTPSRPPFPNSSGRPERSWYYTITINSLTRACSLWLVRWRARASATKPKSQIQHAQALQYRITARISHRALLQV
jgi:hypothetical protein